MKEARQISDDDLAMAICMNDELLFMQLFWSDAITEEMTIEQKLMLCDRSKRVLACTGRKTGKTLILEARTIRMGINHVQKGGGITEAMLFTPRDSQLSPLIDRIYGRINRTPFLKAFMDEMKRGEDTKFSFKTGMMVYARIEGISGRDDNMVAIRARYILGDELAFGNEKCHSSRLQTALPDCEWWYGGVPNGVRATPFFRLDQTKVGEGWSRHKCSTFVNPLYGDPKAREELIQDYGGEKTQGYQTQVLGHWGDELQSSFPPGAIAIGVQPFYVKTLTSALRNTDTAVALALGIPAVRAEKFCIGWDYGYSPDPSVLVIAYSREPGRWEVYARIEMRQVVLPLQCRIIRHLYRSVLVGRLAGLCCDYASAIQTLQDDDPKMAEVFHRTEPGGKMEMTDDLGQTVMVKNEKTDKDEPLMNWVKQYLTEQLRQFMINENLLLPGIHLVLPNDTPMLEELAGTTEKKTQGGRTVYYGPPDPEGAGRMLDHNTDAARQLVDAILHASETGENLSEADLIGAMGWAGTARGSEEHQWKAPWQSE